MSISFDNRRYIFLLLAVISIVGIVTGCDSDSSGERYYWYVDADGDGYGDVNQSPVASENQPAGYVEDYTDCDDTDAGINPSADENYSDDIDHDCDGCAYEACCLTGDSAVYNGSISINLYSDLEKLKNYKYYYTTITGDLTITNTSLFSLIDTVELKCLETIGGDLIIQFNEALCDADEFADRLTVNGSKQISDNGTSVTCP